jgi:signal transduction histidine kinase/DNA-binding NarL/FixJ family response regulator
MRGDIGSSGKRTWLILLTAGVTAIGLWLAALFVEHQVVEAHRVREQSLVRERLLLLQSRLEGNLRSNILLVRGLVSVVAAHPDLTQAEFARYARPLFEGQSGLRNIGAAPDMVIRFMFPLAGNEKAIGLDYRKTPAQFAAAERARDTRELVLAGPLTLAQGGTGLIGRIPVFVEDQKGASRFWGLISAVIDVEKLYRESGLLDADLPVDIALRGKDGTGESGEVFFGDAGLFAADTLQMRVALPVGTWQMAARPKGGWSYQPDNLAGIRLGFILAALLILGPMLLLAVYDARQRRAEAQQALSEARLMRDLDAARLAAEAGSRAKSEFLATMSHEIRTPMNGVLGMADLLLMTPLNDEQKGFVATLQSSGRSLLGIINDILDFSKIEAGRLTLESIDFDLAALAAEVCDLLRPRAVEKDVLLVLDCPEDLPACLRGDALRIRQILVNLVGNAVKFTQVGRIDVEVGWREVEAGSALVRLSVRDTGIGIAPEAQVRLFNHFSQVDASTTRRFGGTGLGLTISKRLIEAMQGRIGVVSALDQGACFWFELVLPVCSTTQPATLRRDVHDIAKAGEADTKFHGSVLLVEDNPVNMQVARQMLARLGVDVSVAENGRIGVALFAAQHFDLVLMDMQMPEMDGIEATQKIRALQASSTTGLTPIVALTANVQPEDRERCFAAGMNDFVTKPFRQVEIVTVLQRWLGVRVGMEGAPPKVVPREKVGAGGMKYPAVGTAQEATASLPTLDTRVLDDLSQGTGMSVAELVAMLFADIQRMAAELETASVDQRMDDMRRLAHSIKSSSAQLGALRLSALARVMESAVRDKQLETFAASQPEFRALLAELQAAVEVLPVA